MEKRKSSIMVMLIFLHIMLMIYSMSGILSKTAALSPFLSPKYCICYSGIIFLLGIYAIGWQQIIKRLPLTLAFSNKAVTVIWGIIWGNLFFGEAITTGKIVGALLVIIGIAIFSLSDVKAEEENA